MPAAGAWVERSAVRGVAQGLPPELSTLGQHRVWIDLKAPGGGPQAQPLGQARPHTDEQPHRHLLAMQDRAMMLGTIALARGTLAGSPGVAVRMAIGAPIAQPPPAAIPPACMGTQGPRRVDRTGASVGGRHGAGRPRRWWMGRRGCLGTQGTVRLVGQPCKRGGSVGVLAWWRRLELGEAPGAGACGHSQQRLRNRRARATSTSA